VKWKIQLYVCGQIISVCNSEIIIKIGQYLRKLCSNEKGSRFFDSQSRMSPHGCIWMWQQNQSCQLLYSVQ